MIKLSPIFYCRRREKNCRFDFRCINYHYDVHGFRVSGICPHFYVIFEEVVE
jgi:hypothetical protein